MTSAVRVRFATVAETLDPSVDRHDRVAVKSTVLRALTDGGNAEVWLLLSVLYARLPKPSEVIDARRMVVAQGAQHALSHHVRLARRSSWWNSRGTIVKVAVDQDLVDVHHTARTRLATGIQRVARMTLREWMATHDILPVGWTRDLSNLRGLTPNERSNALYGNQPHAHERHQGEVLVPWKSRYILVELAIENARVDRMAALAEFSGNRCFVLGFDCVPLTTSETTGAGMGTAFSRNLTAIAHFDAVTTISRAAAGEYGGWRRMLGSVGLKGPTITPVLLPSEAGIADEEGLTSAMDTLGLSDRPMVLCVGSHEPRKNHGAVVHAADRLWRAGLDFQLVFIGGNSWGNADTAAEIEELVEAGRPLTIVSKPSDALLWCAYSLATVSIFPSINEGFGLPVAESLAMGTPVITSDFGSMAEIAAQGGCILVDPRDDAAIASAIERVLTDPEERARLAAEARVRNNSSWASYSRELWESFPVTP